jgi:hypothetical protein
MDQLSDDLWMKISVNRVLPMPFSQVEGFQTCQCYNVHSKCRSQFLSIMDRFHQFAQICACLLGSFSKYLQLAMLLVPLHPMSLQILFSMLPLSKTMGQSDARCEEIETFGKQTAQKHNWE